MSASGAFSLSVVVPARDEELAIGTVVRCVLERTASVGVAVEVIVVDDGSRDGTARVVDALAATGHPVRLVRHAASRGYGAALRSGFLAARHDWVFLTDGDGQFGLDELARAIDLARTGVAVFGYRAARADARPRVWLGALWSALVRRALGVTARDVDCAFKLFPRWVLERAPLVSEGAAISAELVRRIARAGVHAIEIPVVHLPRMGGRASGAHPHVAFRAALELLRLWLSSGRPARAETRVLRAQTPGPDTTRLRPERLAS